MKLLKGLAWGLAIEAAAVGVFVGASEVQGTSWALPFLAMVGLPLLAVTFQEKPKRRGYGEAHHQARQRHAVQIGDWPDDNLVPSIAFDLSKKENA